MGNCRWSPNANITSFHRLNQSTVSSHLGWFLTQLQTGIIPIQISISQAIFPSPILVYIVEWASRRQMLALTDSLTSQHWCHSGGTRSVHLWDKIKRGKKGNAVTKKEKHPTLQRAVFDSKVPPFSHSPHKSISVQSLPHPVLFCPYVRPVQLWRGGRDKPFLYTNT